MKKVVFVACACIMLLSVILTGCEWLPEVELDYVTVTVQARANVTIQYRQSYSGEPTDVMPFAGATVRIEIVKAGGERKTFDVSVPPDGSGWTNMVSATFNVYKEQEVTVTGKVISAINGLETPRVEDVLYDYETFFWDTIWNAAGDFGESCTFSASLYMYDVFLEPK